MPGGKKGRGDASGSNAKNSLADFVQRILGRSLVKEDIEYKTTKHDDQHQTVITLHCLDDQEFAGELCGEREAQHAAAITALQELQAQYASKRGPNGEPPTKKVKGVKGEEIDIEASTLDVSVKNKLNVAVKRILDRGIEDGDVKYDVVATSEGQQCTVSMPTMPGAWATKEFTGPCSPFKRDAMLTAASLALDAIMADPKYGQMVDLSRIPDAEARARMRKETEKKKREEKRNEEGTRKPKPSKNADMFPGMEMAMLGKGKGKGEKGGPSMAMMGMMMMMMKGKGKGKGKGKAADM